ncbi:MAG: DUF4388 domain-containing protein [Trueperaceae bacterium]
MTGTLGLFSLVDLFQLLAGAKRTGRLAVDHPRGGARVYFDAGLVTHAEFAGHEGEDAVYALFADERGDFSFRAGLPAPKTSVELRTHNLVLEAVRKLDESRRDGSDDDDVPYEADVVPERSDDPGADLGALGPTERKILEQVDGRRSLGRIGAVSHVAFEDVTRIVARLVAAGVLIARRRRPRTARLVVRATDEAIPVGAAVLDATIVQAWTRATGHEPHEVLCRRDDGRVERLRLRGRDGVGPFLLMGREPMLRTGLQAEQALLVRPVEDEA